MNPAGNDWTTPIAAQNICMTEADQFCDRLAAALAMEFARRYVKTVSGGLVTEVELRSMGNPAQPVNLWGILTGAAATEVNVAELRGSVRAAALSGNPVAELASALKQALPTSDIQAIILRVPSIQSAVRSAIAAI